MKLSIVFRNLAMQRAIWDRLYAHLTLLTSRGVMSAEELADVFAPLLVTCDLRCIEQV